MTDGDLHRRSDATDRAENRIESESWRPAFVDSVALAGLIAPSVSGDCVRRSGGKDRRVEACCVDLFRSELRSPPEGQSQLPSPALPGDVYPYKHELVTHLVPYGSVCSQLTSTGPLLLPN